MHQARDSRKPGHYWADNEIIDEYAAKVGVYGLAVYHALCRYADKEGQSFPSHATLAKQLKVSPRKVHDALRLLEKEGLIEIEHRQKETGEHMSNLYTLRQIKKPDEAPKAVPLMHDVHNPHAPHAVPLMHDVQPNNTQLEQDPIKKERIAANGTRPAAAKPAKTPTEHQAVIDAYVTELGYTPSAMGREAKAAQWLVQNRYSAAQVVACYRRMKSDPFWQEKFLSLQNVAKQIPEMSRATGDILSLSTPTAFRSRHE
jgi:predicted ArsR family transcriptional regulator